MSRDPSHGRRRVPRRGFEQPVGILVGGKYTIERAYQVGEGGMMVSYAPSSLKPGTLMVVSFFLSPMVTVLVRAVVRNTAPAKEDATERYGIEFMNLEFQYKREIRNFVASAGANEAA